MAEKVNQANSANSDFPNNSAVAPTSNTPYIQPVIGKLGYDTNHPDVFGLGVSPDNGVTFHVFASFKGLIFDEDDVNEKIWPKSRDLVKSEVNSATAEIPAVKSTANAASQRAEEAIKQSTTNSEAIININSAASAAKSDANVALQNAVADFNKEKSANQAAYAALHSSVTSNQADIGSISKSLDGLSTNLKQYAQDAVSQGKTIAELKQNQSDVSATVASVEGNVNQLKVDTKNIQATASDNKSDIANLQISASSASVAIKDANSNVAVAVATASQASVELQDAKRNIAAVQATAEGLQGTVANAQSDIDSLKIDAEGIHQTLTGQGNQIANINVTLNGLNSKYEGVSGDLGKLKSQAQWITVTSAVDLNNIKTPCHEFLKGTVTNAPNESAWWYLTVEGSDSGRITQTVIADQSNNRYTRRWADGWSAWVKDATQTDVTALSNRITTNSTQITQNKQAIALKASQADVDTLNNTVKSQSASLSVLNNQIATKVTSADVEKAIDGKGYVTKDFVESSLTQNAKSLSESISSIDGKVQNITADVNGLQSTVKNKADVSQITQLNNLISTKVNQDDYKSAITQLGDDINARVQKGDLISQINLEARQTLIESKKLFLDADSVVFSGKAFIPDAAIAHLSLDKLTAGHITVPIADKYGNQIELGNDGINIISGLVVEDSANSGSDSSDSNTSDTTTVSNAELANLAAAPVTALNTALFTISDQPDNPNPSSSASSGSSSASSSVSSSASSDSPDSNKIGYGVKLTSSGLKMYQHRQYVKTTGAEPKSEDFTLLDVNPIKSPASNNSKKLPEGLAFMIQTQKYSSVLGPETPHNFLALGRKYYNDANDYTGTDFYDVVYSAEDGNGYNVGLHVNTSLYTKPYGADHGIRTAWVSWSNWDEGQKYPAIVNDTANWGGIAFPSSGKATIFDASGHAFWPTQSYGPYNGYGG